MTDPKDITAIQKTVRTSDLPEDGFNGAIKPDVILGGKYKVISLLGKGGMGTVYRVLQIFLNKELALKTLDEHAVPKAGLQRFQIEARAASSLNHANLVQVHDFGLLDNGNPYLVMDFVDGITFADHLKLHGPLDLGHVPSLFSQACFGLLAAHQQGIVHRDIKPGNLMLVNNKELGSEGSVKIVDFGIAKITMRESGEIQALTKTGEIFGSPLYMSPEQCIGGTVDQRSDIYSLGCVLFEMLTGTPPHLGPNALATMMLHDSGKIPTLKEASLGNEFPLAIEQVLAKMLRRNPSERYQNIGMVAHDLSVACKGAAMPKTASPAKAKAPPKRSKIVVSMSLNKLIGIGSFVVLITATISGTTVYYFKSGPHAATPRNQPQVIIPETEPDTIAEITGDVDNSLHQAEAKLAKANPIVSKPVLVDHKPMREFTFPSYSIGKLYRYQGFEPADFLKQANFLNQANGLVHVPIDVPLVFFVQECSAETTATLATPSLFEKIGTTEFHGLALEGEPPKLGGISFKERAKNIAKIIGVAQTWTNLEFVSLRNFRIDDALKALNKLKHLKNLQIIKCKLDSLQSAAQPVFRQLTGLRLEQVDPKIAKNILKQVDGSSNLQTLILSSTSPGNFDYLEGCSKLSFLEVNGVNAYLDDDQLRNLSKVKSLKILYISSDKTPELQIKEILRRLTQLKEIRLPKDLYTINDVRNFTALSDKVQFIDRPVVIDSAVSSLRHR
jgi:serine/threonine protein kinase